LRILCLIIYSHMTTPAPLESGRANVDALLALITSATKDATAIYEATGAGVPSPNSHVSHPLDFAPDALALKKAIRVLEGACEQLCATLAQPMHTIANVSSQIPINIGVLIYETL
jgi:hypothetical protein